MLLFCGEKAGSIFLLPFAMLTAERRPASQFAIFEHETSCICAWDVNGIWSMIFRIERAFGAFFPGVKRGNNTTLIKYK